jgi:NTP pyrophosphatase (non-canonical NTP hydrolase)
MMLSGESSVDLNLLAESQELFDLIKKNTPYSELLEWVNENF